MPQTIVAFAPIVAPALTRVRLYSFFLTMALLGFTTLVNTIEGPQKTSSSSSTPVYTETLFWILTLLPIRQPGDTTTFCPRLQRLPILLPDIMWEKCQIRVSSPISQGSSMTTLGWAKYFLASTSSFVT